MFRVSSEMRQSQGTCDCFSRNDDEDQNRGERFLRGIPYSDPCRQRRSRHRCFKLVEIILRSKSLPNEEEV